ncbi:MAG: prenyltransferase/squalene oxidase repeat-containing protein, partial [Isosphaeraceae bacterium]
MNRPLIGMFACLALCVSPAMAQRTPVETARTARALAAFQNADGGFAAKVGGPSTLGTTSSVIRSLKNVGGSVPDVFKCIDYVKSCYDKETGGFAPTPGGTPDVHTTAIGLMAVNELKIADGDTVRKAVAYLVEHAKTFEDVRIAVAGLEAVNAKSPKFPAWIDLVNADRNADGTWGEGPGKARATGGA